MSINGVKTYDNYCQVGESFCQKLPPEQWLKSSFLDSTMIEFEREMRNSMMGKVMENLEKRMMDQTKMLDEMKHQQDLLVRQLNKDRQSQHIPPQLKNEGIKSSLLWQTVHDFITNSSFDIGDDMINRKANLKCLDPEMYQIILSHGIGAWLSTLSSGHLEKLIKKIYSDTSQWISKIWRFPCCASLFHSTRYDGFLKICKVALVDRYPKYYSDGYKALYYRPPVIYINSAADPDLLHYLQLNLGLPMDSINLVPNNFELGGDESMDLMALEQLIIADISAGKMPLVIYAFAGSPNTGAMDKLSDIHQLCFEHKIWLHIEGLRLSQLAFLQVPVKVNNVSSKVKSVTLDIGSWLGIPSVPYATLIVVDINETNLQKLGFDGGYAIQNTSVLSIFPLWIGLQLMGHDGIVAKIENNCKINSEIFMHLKEVSSLKILSPVKQIAKKSNKTDTSNKMVIESSGIKNFMETVLSFLLEGHVVPAVILFRYNPSEITSSNEESGNPLVSFSPFEENSIKKKPRFVNFEDNCETRLYLDSLNQWLADNLSANFPQISLTTINLPSEGLCLRICVQENIIGQDVKVEDVEKFVESIKTHITIMDSTSTRRTLFQEIVASKSELVFIDLPSWAGLGSVLYLPESCREIIFNSFDLQTFDISKIDFLHFLATSSYLKEINNINKTLTEELRNDDEAFSLGRFLLDLPDESLETGKECITLFCVRFGLITNVTVIDQLIEHVLKKAHHIEESSKYLDKLSQLVKEGIMRVTEDLAREHEEKVKQEGIFRQVPYIDSLINWWSPPAKTQIIGRSLNLSSGEINDTEDIYKYKMQLSTGPNSVFTMGSENQNLM